MAGRRASKEPTALVASSAYYAGNEAPRIYGTDKGWQAECYRYRSIIGEARYASEYYGNALGKCTMHITEPVETEGHLGWKPSYDSEEALWLNDMFSGRNTQSQALRDIGGHLFVGGECFLLGKSTTGQPGVAGDGSLQWEVASPLEMRVNGTGWLQQVPGATIPYEFTANDVVIRIWRRDPSSRDQADSPFKSLLPVLNEIENLTKHLYSQVISRLAGAGIMWVPEGMDFPAEPAQDGKEVETANGPGRLAKAIGQTGEVAIKNQGSAQARVPIIIQAPDDLIGKVQLMHFWSDLDEKATGMRADALHRFAAGCDLPNETIEGMASNSGTGGGSSNGVSHWGAWQIEESSIKMHVEPGMDLVVAAILTDWIRVQVPGTNKMVGYSTGGLKLRPDRSREALELYDRGLLKVTALFREVGFDPGDMADDDDRLLWLTLNIAKGSNTPEQVAAAARAFGLPLPDGGGQEPALEAPPAPSLQDHPTRPRDPSEQPTAALLTACHAMTLQALQRAGNRFIQQGLKPEGVPTQSVHCYAVGKVDADKILANAFPMANELLEGIADPADVMPQLRAYVTSLVATKAEHSRDEMKKWLLPAKVTA